MALQWFVIKSEHERLGPFTSEQLRQMANSGELLPSHHVWHDGLSKPGSASRIRGLFTERALPPTPPPIGTNTHPSSNDNQLEVEQKPSTEPTVGTHAVFAATQSSLLPNGLTKVSNGLKSSLRSFLGNARAASQLVGMQAERTKLQTISLTSAYHSLGKLTYNDNSLRDQLPDTYATVDTLVLAARDLKGHAEQRQSPSGVTEKAKAAAKIAADKAQVKILETRYQAALVELGKRSFEILKSLPTHPESISSILAIHSRLVQIDGEIDALSASASGRLLTPKRLAVGAVAGLCALLIVASVSLFGVGSMGGTTSALSGSNSSGRSVPYTNDTHLENVYDSAYTEGVKHGKTYARQINGLSDLAAKGGAGQSYRDDILAKEIREYEEYFQSDLRGRNSMLEALEVILRRQLLKEGIQQEFPSRSSDNYLHSVVQIALDTQKDNRKAIQEAMETVMRMSGRVDGVFAGFNDNCTVHQFRLP